MNKEKISLLEIAELLASKASISKRAAEEFLKMLFLTIEETLLVGEVVKIKNFGQFKLAWNEPRKSVNVQTGEEILLPGYNKVSFTPDPFLKDLVNEPYSHLQPVALDSDQSRSDDDLTQNEVPLDPLRIFTEQASEIKDLLSEIQALSEKKPKIQEKSIPEPSVKSETVKSIPDYVFDDVVTVDAEKEINEAVSDNDIDYQVVASLMGDAPELKIDSDSSTEYTPNPFVKNVNPKKKPRVFLWISIVLSILMVCAVCFYMLHPSTNKMVNGVLFPSDTTMASVKEHFAIDKVFNTVSGWFTTSPKNTSAETVVVPKMVVKSDSTKIQQTVDSLQILFDTPRVYPEFIATERIHPGSRLARMALRYYGTSDFWVYIYEANKSRIVHPDRIPAGTLIYIPKVDPRLIDASNPRCMAKARELHDLYVK